MPGGNAWPTRALIAHLGFQGSSHPGEGHTGATGDHSLPWSGFLGGPKALSRVTDCSVGLSELSLRQEG